jgi:hypothetical protein
MLSYRSRKTLKISGEDGSLVRFERVVRVARQPKRGEKRRLHLVFKALIGNCRTA